MTSELEQIVRDLAKINSDRGDGICLGCSFDPSKQVHHSETCVFRRAKEWVVKHEYDHSYQP